ncbi:hypothetical protein UH38_20905 [Aliterella atlantica CENA595]|uniref:Uncharacterized protein n=1 Tax=Aliterella atlantica CENA595 TaxID=1618023 RepID=A0A0D8ZRS7_9CYAN|nr:hypothetical protein UH38_20905 [Aliterella atlantica CENA595]
MNLITFVIVLMPPSKTVLMFLRRAIKIDADINAIAFMVIPTAVVCPKPNGVCHHLRVMALETRKTVLLPQILWEK